MMVVPLLERETDRRAEVRSFASRRRWQNTVDSHPPPSPSPPPSAISFLLQHRRLPALCQLLPKTQEVHLLGLALSSPHNPDLCAPERAATSIQSISWLIDPNRMPIPSRPSPSIAFHRPGDARAPRSALFHRPPLPSLSCMSSYLPPSPPTAEDIKSRTRGNSHPSLAISSPIISGEPCSRRRGPFGALLAIVP